MVLGPRQIQARRPKGLAWQILAFATTSLLSMTTESRPVSLVSGGGDTLHAFGEQVTFHLVGAQTGGKFDGDYSTRWRTTVHLHLNEDELFVAREGTVAFFSDGQWHDLGPGGVAFISRESVHTFTNTGDAPSRMPIETSPVGFETFFARCAQEFAAPGDPICSVLSASPSNTGSIF
jgi:mannose-6-phosphate isomerase-like protein (cupin superfamily)